MASQTDIEITALQVCNRIGMDAKLPSENMVLASWKELAHDRFSKGSVAGKTWKDKTSHNVVVERVRQFYKDHRKKMAYD